jgi:two-component system, NarL family, nitrate/nitrite response regulator NarL
MDRGSGKVRILLADDHKLFREGLRNLLESQTGFEVVGAASDGEEAIALTRKLKPDVLLLDLAMPRCSGLDALRELTAAATPVRTIIVAASIETAQIAGAIQLGVRGILLKDATPELLFESIRSVVAGQYWMGRESVSSLVQVLRDLMPRPKAPAGAHTFKLTPREIEVIEVIVAGYTNKDIAQKFSIREQTVKHHLTNIFDKLGVSNRLELVLFAAHHQIIEESSSARITSHAYPL